MFTPCEFKLNFCDAFNTIGHLFPGSDFVYYCYCIGAVFLTCEMIELCVDIFENELASIV